MATRYTTKFKDTTTDLNSEWKSLIKMYKIKDLRVEYLHTFEQVLNLNCPTPIWENPRYFRITSKYPVDTSGYTTQKKFRLYLMLYGYIMQDAGLLKMNVVDDVSAVSIKSTAWEAEA